MINKINLSIILFLFFCVQLNAQWKPAGASGEYIYNVTRIDSTLFAGAVNGVYLTQGTGVNNWKINSTGINQIYRFVKYNEDILALGSYGIYKRNIRLGVWNKINEQDLPLDCLLFLDDVWLAGVISDGVYRSTNEGKNWIYNQDYDTDSLSYVTSLLKMDDKVFAVTGYGLQLSTDRGLTWKKINNSISNIWHADNTFLNLNDTLYAAGRGGIFRSFDRGNTWFYYGLYEVKNILHYANRLYVVTGSGVFFRNDGDNRWNNINPDGYEKNWGFQPFCVDVYKDKLFLATARGIYYMNLIEFESPRLFINYDVKIDFGELKEGIQKDTFIVVQNRGYKDLIVSNITSNSSYFEISPAAFTLPPGDSKVVNIKILADHSGIIDATIKINSNDLKSVEEIPVYANIQKLDFYLSQNYPNPFNSYTTFSYLTSGVNHVSLELYDVLGTKVATVVNQTEKPGKHTVVFNSSDLSSGIYFYKITTEKYSNIKKMILIK